MIKRNKPKISLRFYQSCLMVFLAYFLWFGIMPGLVYSADFDQDGIDDQLEDQLLNTYAPVVFLHPLEDSMPSNVDWFLQHSWLRFHHGDGCGDCEIIPGPGHPEPHPTQTTLIDQYHYRKFPLFHWPPWDACSHNGDPEYSWKDHSNLHSFFLQIGNNDHSGCSNPADWLVYGHVYPNTMGGINIQYWFFYAFNNGFLTQHHEGDWECVMVELRSDMSVNNMYFFQHEDGIWVAPGNITWYNNTHPVVLSARGSHASYQDYGACGDHYFLIGIIPDEQCYWCTPAESSSRAWFTWAGGKPSGAPGFQGGGVINVGEKVDGHALYRNGQKFIHYSGRWGEVGSAIGTNIIGDYFSGPRGPAYQDKWNLNRVNPGQKDFTFVDDDYNASTPGWGVDHFNRLYDGIFHVKDGGTVYVYAGTYNERLIVEKSINLLGINGKDVTFIDAQNQTGQPILSLRADNIVIKGFTFQNGSVGIELHTTHFSEITQNTITNFTWGMGAWIGSENNKIYHNNFIGNTIHATAQYGKANTWSHGEPPSGNYWDNYTGWDSNGDGIGQTTYDIVGDENADRYPLMAQDGWERLVDPYISIITLSQDGNQVLTTCPAGDSTLSTYIIVHLYSLTGVPIDNIPASAVTLNMQVMTGTEYFGTPACTFTPVDSVSDGNGQIRFQVIGDTSIVGDIEISAATWGNPVHNTLTLRCNSVDFNTDGVVNLSDAGFFTSAFHGEYDWRCDYVYDGVLNLSDISAFAQHNGHSQ